MSVGICGYIDFQSDSISDMVDLSFYVMQQAITCKLGCKLGGNISDDAFSKLENDRIDSMILMEIMDTPLDNYANDFCQPTIDISEDPNLDISDKITLNLNCLQEFLLSILNYKNVNKIMLHFDYVFSQGDEKVVETSIDKFTDVMNNYYFENDYFAPELKIIISRD